MTHSPRTIAASVAALALAATTTAGLATPAQAAPTSPLPVAVTVSTAHAGATLHWWGADVWLDHSLAHALSTSLSTGAGVQEIVDILVANNIPDKAARAIASALTTLAHAADSIAAADHGNGVTISQPWLGNPTVSTR